MILNLLVTASTVAICVGLVKLGLMYLDSYRKLLRSNCFRGPRALPLIGNGHLFIGTTADIYKTLRELATKYQSPYRIWFGPRLCFAVYDAEQAKRVLLDPNALEKSFHYDILKLLLRRGLVTAEVSKWKLQRSVIQPLFSRTVLETFVQKIRRHALLTVEKMGMDNPGSEFVALHYLLRFTFDSIMDTSMSIDLDTLAAKDCAFFDAVASSTDTIMTRISKPWLYPDLIFNFTSFGQTCRKNVEYIYDYIRNVFFFCPRVLCSNHESKGGIVVTHKLYVNLDEIHVKLLINFENSSSIEIPETVRNAKNEIAEQLESRPKVSLLGLLLTSTHADYKISDEQIFEEIVTIIGAGYESSANVLSFAIYILASYPDIQDKVYAEVREIYEKSNSEGLETTLQDMDRMAYLTRVIKETLRFFPTVPIVCRYLSEDLNIGEYTLPAGSSAVINFNQLHRNPKYWPEPLEFNPDRFLPNHPLGPRHPYAYMPFSTGARNCIGNKYALLSVKMFLVILTSRYIIKTKTPQQAKDLELKICVSLRTKDPLMVSIERRFPEIS